MRRQNLLIVHLFVTCICGYTAVNGLGPVGDEGAWAVLADEKIEKHFIDPVCKKEVSTATPHAKELDGKLYYFCSEACKRAFKKEMVDGPVVKRVYVDPVCGCRVSEDTPYVASFNDLTYHFCLEFCKNRFLASPKELSCYCAEGEHCPHRESRVGVPCEQGPILGWGRWSRWACSVHMKRSDFQLPSK